MKKCPSCDASFKDDVKFCIECGATMNDDEAIEGSYESENIEEDMYDDDYYDNCYTTVIDKEVIDKAITDDNNDNYDDYDDYYEEDEYEDNYVELEKTNEYVEALNSSVKLHFKDNDVYYEDRNIKHNKKNNKSNNNDTNNSNTNNNNNNVSNNMKPQKKNKKIKNKNSNTRIIIAALCVFVLMIFVFNGKMLSAYYLYKANSSENEIEKITYSVQAVKYENNELTMQMLKLTFMSLDENDIVVAGNRLKELKKSLSEDEYNSLHKILIEKDIKALAGKSKYEDAFNEFTYLDKMEVDFKKNENYDDIMLNIISDLTSSPVRGNKGILMDDSSICYDNFDEDVYDEIFEVEESIGYKAKPTIKINLYKYNDGKYRFYDSYALDNAYEKGIQGVYNFAHDRKGVYVHYRDEGLNTYVTSVFTVEDNRIVFKGSVYGSEYTKAQDVDDDGIYEIVSSSINYTSSNSKDNLRYYKIDESGSAPKEIEITNVNSSSQISLKDDYIFENSNKEYLTKEKLEKLSKEELAIARNEIFARHGYKFKEEPFKSHFKSKTWYKVDEDYKGDDEPLNKYEKANYKLIQDFEKQED